MYVWELECAFDIFNHSSTGAKHKRPFILSMVYIDIQKVDSMKQTLIGMGGANKCHPGGRGQGWGHNSNWFHFVAVLH